MPSSIAAAAENLAELLEAATWPGTKPQIAFGPPGDYEEQEVVSLLGVDDPTEEPAALGNRSREEQYVLDVRIKAYDPAADTGREVFLRVLTLREVVRSVVAANSTLDGAVREADVVGGGPTGGSEVPGVALALRAQDGGWVSFAAARVVCKARIT